MAYGDMSLCYSGGTYTPSIKTWLSNSSYGSSHEHSNEYVIPTSYGSGYENWVFWTTPGVSPSGIPTFYISNGYGNAYYHNGDLTFTSPAAPATPGYENLFTLWPNNYTGYSNEGAAMLRVASWNLAWWNIQPDYVYPALS